MFALLAVALVLIYVWFKYKYSFWNKHGFPSIPGRFPLGIVGELRLKVHSSDLMKRFYDENKGKAPGVGLYVMTTPVLLLTEPELAKDILVKHFDDFPDHGFFLNEKVDPLSEHLVMISGQKWKDSRAKLTPTFTSGKLKMMFGTLSTVCDRLIAYLKPSAENEESVEMKEILAAFTTEVISSVAFGFTTKALGNPSNAFRQMAERIMNPPKWETVKFFFMQVFQDLSRILRLAYIPKEATDFFMSVIKNNVDNRESNNFERNDFLQLLIKIKNGLGMTMSEITAFSLSFFIAG